MGDEFDFTKIIEESVRENGPGKKKEEEGAPVEPVKVKVGRRRKAGRTGTDEKGQGNLTETLHTYITLDKAEVLKVYCMVHKMSVSQFLRGLLESAAGKLRDGISQRDIDVYREYFGREK